MNRPIQTPADNPGHGHESRRGFTYVELVVALAIGAAVLTGAVLAFGTITGTRIVSIQNQNITIGNAPLTNFFTSTNPTLSVPQAPSYSASAQAEILRDKLATDISSAVAVYLLGRDGLNSYRPATINYSGDGRSLLTPMAFRAILPNAGDFSTSSTNALQTQNTSLYILGPSTTNTVLRVRCIYETDFLPIASPPGVYASVRRYVGFQVTDYYQVFYPNQTNTFRPAGYVYNAGSVNGVAVTKPFYLLWWPDPLATLLPTATSGGQGRTAYTNMANQTSLFFAIPAFPDL